MEPKYLWNGYNNGKTLTGIGKKFLNDPDVAQFLTQTSDLRDIENFCPNYWDLDDELRKYFWLYLFSSIARYENHRFDPEALHLEKSSGRHSIGIFQVDTENCGYGEDQNKFHLFNEENNFKCALRLSVRYVKHGVSVRTPKGGGQIADGRYNGTIGRSQYVDGGMDYYWSVLRNDYKGYAYSQTEQDHVLAALGRRSEIQQLTQSIEICQ